MSDHVVPLTRALEESRFGGKAVQLGTAIRSGLPVPDGFALSWRIVDQVAAGDATSCAACAGALNELGGSAAVRSSAVGEDSAGASFAGQHLTRLGVRSAPALVEALLAIWESGRAPSAMAYRQKLGLSEQPRIGVVIQRMVDAECAGVMFTRDPITGADVRVIEAAWGLGESVVSGFVDPDRYRLQRGGVVLEVAIGDKHAFISAVADGQTEERPTDDALRGARCLDDGQLKLLDSLGSACDQAFGGNAHDIEWAFERDILYLLQRRAITR